MSVALFTRMMATMQNAGLPVLRSLRIAEADLPAGPVKAALSVVVHNVETGRMVSEALAQHAVFDRLLVNMFRAGENGGALEIVLQRLVDWHNQNERIDALIDGVEDEQVLFNAELARTSFLLGTMVSSGVPILEALEIVSETSQLPEYIVLYERLGVSVREGGNLAHPMAEAGFVPTMAVQMIEVGEETGDLDVMLYSIAAFYEGEAERALRV